MADEASPIEPDGCSLLFFLRSDATMLADPSGEIVDRDERDHAGAAPGEAYDGQAVALDPALGRPFGNAATFGNLRKPEEDAALLDHLFGARRGGAGFVTLEFAGQWELLVVKEPIVRLRENFPAIHAIPAEIEDQQLPETTNMPGTIQRVRVATLKPHPLNSQIYGQRPLEDLISSIDEHGLLEPLVITPERRVVSGHRRLEALRALDIRLAPARIERFADDEVALVEYNRSRTRTWTERYRELQVLLPRLQGAAQERRVDGARRGAAARHGLPLTKVGHRHGRCRVYEEAGRVTGLGRESARKLIRVFEAVDAGLAARDLAERLDGGDISLHRAYLAVRRARSGLAKRDGRHAGAALDFPPFDIWTFTKRDTSYDQPGSRPDGCPPPQAWVRLVQLLTDPGDLVVDPMAGAGTILRVCERLGRECLAFDIEPRGPGVLRHDLLTGFPPAPRPPRLVILDPPYGDQRPYSRRRNDLSRRRTAEEFVGRLERCVCTCLPALSPGGALVVVAGNDSRGGGSDLAWEVGAMLRRHVGQVRRIWLPYSTSQHPGHRVARAQRERQLLTLQREIFVAPVFEWQPPG